MLVVAGALNIAHATTCGPFPSFHPGDGTSGLPENVQLFVDLGYVDDAILLTDAAGDPVPFTSRPALRTSGVAAVVVVPDEPLPAGVYQTTLGNWGDFGTATFIVSAPADTTAPAPAALRSNESAGNLAWTWGVAELVWLAVPPDTFGLRFWGTGPAGSFGPMEQPFAAGAPLVVGPRVCGPTPTDGLSPNGGDHIELTVQVLDVAGNASEPVSFEIVTSPDPYAQEEPEPEQPEPELPQGPTPTVSERGCVTAAPAASWWTWMARRRHLDSGWIR
ncbi:MAG: hypothetical protein R3F61_24810 [Myxococcota bacterium]